MRQIILKPIVSEKATSQAAVQNTYHFKVARDANKVEIQHAIEARFDVKVKSVRTVNMLGKSSRQYTRAGVLAGKKADWKKAIVTLQDGYSLDIYATEG